MADVELVIKIPEELYNYLQTEKYDEHLDRRFDYMIRHSVINGTPLPKGHEDLIDRSCLYDFRKYLQTCPKSCNEDDEIWFTSEEIDNRIKQYSAIIEADKEE